MISFTTPAFILVLFFAFLVGAAVASWFILVKMAK